MDVSPRVLVVAHDASRTGAPKVLSTILQHQTSHDVAEVAVVLMRGGPLADGLAHRQNRVILNDGPRRFMSELARGLELVGAPAIAARAARRLHLIGQPFRRRPDVVVANTLAALTTAVELCPSGSRLVCHVHELDAVADRVLPFVPSIRSAALGRVDRFIAAGPAVAHMLAQRWGIPASKVSVVDEFIEPAEPVTDAERLSARRSLGLENSRPVVVAVGQLGPRKGTDLFIGLAAACANHDHRPTFLWVGGDPDSAAWQEATLDIEELRRSDVAVDVELIATVRDPRRFLAAADLLVTTAREDPYPLALLEAGAVGLPVAGFGAGGVRRMLSDAGLAHLVARQGDLLGLSTVVTRLLADPAQRSAAGDQLRQWVHATHLADQWIDRWWHAVLEATA